MFKVNNKDTRTTLVSKKNVSAFFLETSISGNMGCLKGRGCNILIMLH